MNGCICQFFTSQKTVKEVVKYTSSYLAQENCVRQTKSSGTQNKTKEMVKESLSVMCTFWDKKTGKSR